MSYLALVGAPAEKSRSQAGSWASRDCPHDVAARQEEVKSAQPLDSLALHLDFHGDLCRARSFLQLLSLELLPAQHQAVALLL
ncbi:MAG: hypothetical protein JO365_37010 [Bradyrhizobium sp.]|nr:hypothetical protein [Bradyrhizobium sp.]